MNDPLEPLLYIKQLFTRMQQNWQRATRTHFARLSIYIIVVIELNVAAFYLLHTAYRIGITVILHSYERTIGVEVPAEYAELFASRLLNEVFWTLLIMAYITLVLCRFAFVAFGRLRDEDNGRSELDKLIRAFRIPLPVNPKGRMLRKLHGWVYAA